MRPQHQSSRIASSDSSCASLVQRIFVSAINVTVVFAVAISATSAMAQFGGRFAERNDGSLLDGTRVGVSGKYDHVSDDFFSENGGGLDVTVGKFMGERALLQGGVDITFLENAENYNAFFGGSILNYVRGESICEWLTSTWVVDYTALEPFGIQDWGARSISGIRLTERLETGFMGGYGFDEGSTPDGLNNFYAGYLQFSPSNEIAAIAYMGGAEDPDVTIAGGKAAIKFGRKSAVIVDLGGDDNGLFGTQVSFQYLFGSGAPRNDGLGGGMYQLQRTGSICPVPFWQAQARRR
ncbi:MAG: hypothetical protein ACR2NM_10905 [Bythopirellula sp.]